MNETATETVVSPATFDDVVGKLNELVEVTEKQNEMLALIVEQVKPTLDALRQSPLGMMFGVPNE